MEDSHLASLGSSLYRGFGRLRLFILDLILIRLFCPWRRNRPPFGYHGICRNRSSLKGGRREAGVGKGPVLAQPCSAPGAEISFRGNLLPAVMTELGHIHGLFMDRGLVDFLMDDRPAGWFCCDFCGFRFHDRAPHDMF